MPADSRRRLGGATSATTAPSAAAATAPAGGAAQPAAQRQVGTGFVNMSDILAANQSGAQVMGQALTSRVQQQGQAAKDAIAGGQATFDAAVGQGTPYYKDKGLTTRDEVRERAARTYTGPRTWEEAGVKTGELAAQAVKAEDNAKALTSQGGRAALLQQQSPGLTAGGASLDAFLAGAGMGAQGRQVAQDYGNLSDILAGARGTTAEQVAAAEQQAKDVAQQYRDLEERWNYEDAPRPYLEPDPEDIARARNPGARVRRNRPGVGGDGNQYDYSDRRSRRGSEVP